MKNATEKGDRGAASLRESGDLRDKERKLVFRHAKNRKSFPANRTAHSLGPAVQTAKRLKGDTETAGKDGVILPVQEEQHETLFFRVRQCTTTFHLRDGDTKQHTAVAFFIVPQEREKRNTKRCNGREGEHRENNSKARPAAGTDGRAGINLSTRESRGRDRAFCEGRGTWKGPRSAPRARTDPLFH